MQRLNRQGPLYASPVMLTILVMISPISYLQEAPSSSAGPEPGVKTPTQAKGNARALRQVLATRLASCFCSALLCRALPNDCRHVPQSSSTVRDLQSIALPPGLSATVRAPLMLWFPFIARHRPKVRHHSGTQGVRAGSTSPGEQAPKQAKRKKVPEVSRQCWGTLCDHHMRQ